MSEPNRPPTPEGPYDPQDDDDTQSVTDSIMDYPMEYGRTYHKFHEGAYLYPNDEQEIDRLDLQHHLTKIVTHGRLFHAPLRNPKKMLDIGTGSGIWPIEMATIFPNCEIFGTDLSPVQPNEVPENVHFYIDDAAEDDWVWKHNSLDFIRTAHMSGAFSSFKDILRKMYDHLAPGGWAECNEFDTKPMCDDGTVPPIDPEKFGKFAFQDWCDMQTRSGMESDPPRQFRIAHRIARWMREVGFVDVQERVTKTPINPWSEDPYLQNVGKWNQLNVLEALSGWSYKPLTNLGWSKPEIEVFLVQVRKSISDPSIHSYFNFHAVIGRKPRPDERRG